MPSITIRREFEDGDHVAVTVRVDSSYPDCLNQARVEAVRAFREALGYVTVDPEDGE